MVNNIQLSIVIAVNEKDKPLLDECLLSIEQQTLSKQICEIIVVSNCDVNSIVNKYLKLNIKTLYLQNIFNLNELRNSGLDVAEGRYIMFMDTNFRVVPARLIDILNFINKNSFYNIFCCNFFKIINTDKIICPQDSFNFCGKIFKTKFLKTNQLNFCKQGVDSLYIFSKLTTKKICFLDKVFCYEIIQKEKGQICEKYFNINIYHLNEYLLSLQEIYNECVQRDIKTQEMAIIIFRYLYYLYQIINIIIYRYGLNNIDDYLNQMSQYYLNVYSQVKSYITQEAIKEEIDNLSNEQPPKELILPNISFPEFEYRLKNQNFSLHLEKYNYFY